MQAAHAKKMTVIALTGRTAARSGRMLRPAIPPERGAPRTMRVQEIHLLVVH
jgi:phosphoheptose isomerase